MIKINLSSHLKIVNILFVLFTIIFIVFPILDIHISRYFFVDDKFLSEKYTFIKVLRSNLKNIMIVIPILSLIMLLLTLFMKKKYNFNNRYNLRFKLALLGFVIGPILGCGLIANLYFKDTWGRARPAYIVEFGGEKKYSQPFIKSDQCYKNCSWISGETSGAFSLMFGSLLLRNHIFLLCNYILGLLVFFCRISMGGHFFSDNIYAYFFMIYLAYLYKYFIYIILKNRRKKK